MNTSTTKESIPGKREWHALSIEQLQDVRQHIQSTFYSMRSVNASFANQYQHLLNEIDSLISRREFEKQISDAEDSND